MEAGKQPKGGNLSWTLLPTSLCALFTPDRGDHEHEHERVTPTLKTLASDAPWTFPPKAITPTPSKPTAPHSPALLAPKDKARGLQTNRHFSR